VRCPFRTITIYTRYGLGGRVRCSQAKADKAEVEFAECIRSECWLFDRGTRECRSGIVKQYGKDIK